MLISLEPALVVPVPFIEGTVCVWLSPSILTVKTLCPTLSLAVVFTQGV